jgi:hypothetical protein
LWPRSLQGQVLLAIALALLVAQTISAVLIWKEQNHRREVSMVSSAAFRLIGPSPEERRHRRLALSGASQVRMIVAWRSLRTMAGWNSGGK